MLDDLTIFSLNQAITVSAASNYAGTGAGSAGAGVLDCGSLVQSFGGSGQFGSQGIFGGSIIKFNIIISVGVPFTGPAPATLFCGLQESPDNGVTVPFAYTDLADYLAENLAALQIPGQVIMSMPIPAIGGSTNPPAGLMRYLRMYYTVANGPFTTGTINARLDIM